MSSSLQLRLQSLFNLFHREIVQPLNDRIQAMRGLAAGVLRRSESILQFAREELRNDREIVELAIVEVEMPRDVLPAIERRIRAIRFTQINNLDEGGISNMLDRINPN